MASQIDVYACIASTSAARVNGVGAAYSPAATFTGTGNDRVSTLPAVASTALVLYDALGTTNRFTSAMVQPSVAGTLWQLCADAGGNSRVWKDQRVAAGHPVFIAGDAAITNADPAAQTGDDGTGLPTGQTDTGKLTGQVWKVVFYPDADGTVEFGLFS